MNDDFFLGVFVLIGVFVAMFLIGAVILTILGEPVI